jgi:heme exporter protein A
VWLLDEPTVSLDAASVALLIAAIDAHVAEGGLAVVATHIPMALTRAQEIRLGPSEGAA